MTKENLILKNNIQSSFKKNIMSKELQKNFKKIFLKTKEDVKDLNKTLNILDKNFKFNFKTKDLKKFKKFKTIALVGMGAQFWVLRQYTNF